MSTTAPTVIRGTSAPDSPLAREAATLVRNVHSPALANHLHRTWWFADAIGQQQGLTYDREVVYLAALLHDLGLVDKYIAEGRFEVDGADAASRFLLENDYPAAKADLVWQAIALHSNFGVADHMGPEIALICLGAHADVLGLRVDEISPEIVEAVVEQYPRLGLKTSFQEALAEVVRRKPHTALGTGLVDIGNRHVHGFAPANVCDLIDAAPFDS